MALKMCMIGCGGISNTSHGPSYVKYRESHPDFVMAACCDLSMERVAPYREKFGFQRAYTDFRKMVETEKPDAVCVIVAEAAAADVGQSILEYGIPMLIEKPPGKTSQETMRLIKAAEKKNVPHMVAFNRRFIPLMKLCRQWLDELKEEIYYIRYDFFRHGRNDPDFSDTAVHAIDAVRFLAGSDYERIRFNYQDIPGKRPCSVYMEASMGDRTMAHIHVCPDAGVVLERATINLAGRTIMLHLPIWGDGFDIPGSLTMINNGKVERVVSGSDVWEGSDVYITNGFYEENKVFFDSVQSGAPMHSSLRSAYQTILVKEAYAGRMELWSKE